MPIHGGARNGNVEYQDGDEAESSRIVRLVHHSFLGRGWKHAALRDAARRGWRVRAWGRRLLGEVEEDLRRGPNRCVDTVYWRFFPVIGVETAVQIAGRLLYLSGLGKRRVWVENREDLSDATA